MSNEKDFLLQRVQADRASLQRELQSMESDLAKIQAAEAEMRQRVEQQRGAIEYTGILITGIQSEIKAEKEPAAEEAKERVSVEEVAAGQPRRRGRKPKIVG